jgi:hypothetical protein
MVTIPSAADLSKSAQKYRKELLMMPVLALEQSTNHMSIRSGIRYKETVGELSGDIQLAPYSESRIDADGVVITPRELETYFGSVVKKFSPNSVYQTIYGSSITKGEALKQTDITRQVLAYLARQIGVNLNKVLWSAKRNATGTTSADLFDGFDTITAAEITAGNIAADKGNYTKLTAAISASNAVDALKGIYEAAADELQGQPSKMFLPKDIYNAYVKDYQATVGAVPYNREYKKTYLEGSDDLCELVALPNKKGSKYIHLTTKGNMLIGVDQLSDAERIEVEKHEAFVLQFIATMFFGCQFESISPERLLVAELV